jgi:hypothetical protein
MSSLALDEVKQQIQRLLKTVVLRGTGSSRAHHAVDEAVHLHQVGGLIALADDVEDGRG